MSVQTEYPHLTTGADGVVRVRGSRYKVLHLVAEHYQHGWTAEELLRQHPDLRPEEVYSVLTYFYDHRDEMIAALKQSLANVTSAQPAQPLSRDELLQRRSSSGN